MAKIKKVLKGEMCRGHVYGDFWVVFPDAENEAATVNLCSRDVVKLTRGLFGLRKGQAKPCTITVEVG